MFFSIFKSLLRNVTTNECKADPLIRSTRHCRGLQWYSVPLLYYCTILYSFSQIEADAKTQSRPIRCKKNKIVHWRWKTTLVKSYKICCSWPHSNFQTDGTKNHGGRNERIKASLVGLNTSAPYPMELVDFTLLPFL